MLLHSNNIMPQDILLYLVAPWGREGRRGRRLLQKASSEKSAFRHLRAISVTELTGWRKGRRDGSVGIRTNPIEKAATLSRNKTDADDC